MIATYLTVIFGTILAQVAPGPNLVAVAGMALGQGRRAALFVAMGVALGTFIWVAAAAFGLGQIVKAYPAGLTALKLAGGAYLLFVAYRGLKAAFGAKEIGTVKARQSMPAGAAFRHGLLVVMTNPKSILFWSAVATFMFGAGLSGIEVLVLAPIGALTSIGVYGAYALLFSSGPARGIHGRFARAIEAIFATTFGVLGGFLVWTGLKEIRI